MPFSDPVAVRREGPFAPLPPQARLTYVWAAPLLAVAFLGVANVVSIPFFVPLVLADLSRALGDGTFTLTPAVLAVVVVVSFAAFAACAVLWARVFERRGPATLGFVRNPARYMRGLALGAVLGALLLGLSWLAAPEDMALLAEGFRRLISEGGPILILVLFGLFALQSGAEEVVYRGWMLSSVTARRGPLVGVAVSAAGFAVVHGHYLIAAPAAGLFAVLGVGLIGVILAFYALAERSIWGVCGLHCAYNFLVMTVATAQALGEQPEVSPIEVVMSALTEITSVTEFDPGLAASAAVLAAIAAASWLIWRRAERARKLASMLG